MAYSDLLKDPRWQKKRLEVMERDNFMCFRCCDKDNTLHVHHGVYYRGRKPWEYPSYKLITLCETCHGEYHDNYFLKDNSDIYYNLYLADMLNCGQGYALQIALGNGDDLIFSGGYPIDFSACDFEVSDAFQIWLRSYTFMYKEYNDFRVFCNECVKREELFFCDGGVKK